jgi:hypothetical protein
MKQTKKTHKERCKDRCSHSQWCVMYSVHAKYLTTWKKNCPCKICIVQMICSNICKSRTHFFTNQIDLKDPK